MVVTGSFPALAHLVPIKRGLGRDQGQQGKLHRVPRANVDPQSKEADLMMMQKENPNVGRKTPQGRAKGSGT